MNIKYEYKIFLCIKFEFFLKKTYNEYTGHGHLQFLIL